MFILKVCLKLNSSKSMTEVAEMLVVDFLEWAKLVFYSAEKMNA